MRERGEWSASGGELPITEGDKMILEHFERRAPAVWKLVRYDMTAPRDIAKHAIRHRENYPTFVVMEDGGALCLACCRAEYHRICEATPGDGWNPSAQCVNYEDTDLCCDHCGEQIPAAYC